MPFLPITKEELSGTPDFIIVTGDAYVDHPSFGTAIISRVLEAEGYSVAILSQPDYRSKDAFMSLGKPRLAFLVNSGNIDSMVAHYTAAKKRRSNDYYSPGCEAGHRPDRAVIVYCNRIREAYGDVPLIIGGLEASTRRFAHYDYWSDSVRRSILVDSRADMLTYGMGENILRRIAFLLAKGVPIKKIRDVRGTCFMEKRDFTPHFEHEPCGEYDDIKSDKKAFAIRTIFTERLSLRATATELWCKIRLCRPFRGTSSMPFTRFPICVPITPFMRKRAVCPQSRRSNFQLPTTEAALEAVIFAR